jgi:glycerophosphoryl diester phosphodiesterase
MVHFSKLAVALGLVLSVYATPKTYSGEKGDKKLEVQAHRGGLGYRPESKFYIQSVLGTILYSRMLISCYYAGTLWAFAKALESGANVLEMDTVSLL